MKLRSNLPQVIQRLKRLQEGIPDAVDQAIAPAHWKGRLEHVALKTLRAQWALEPNVQTRALYEGLTPRLLATLTGVMQAHVASFSLEMPGGLAEQLSIEAAIAYNLGRRTPTGREKKYAVTEQGPERNLAAVRETILQWVRLEKRRDGQDTRADGTPMSDEEIAERIMVIMGLSSVPGRRRTENMKAAEQSLSRAIQQWLDGEGETPPVSPHIGGGAVTVSPQTLNQWMTAVMAAWLEYVRAHLRDRVALKLVQLNERVRTSML